jgi:hypothetical protein
VIKIAIILALMPMLLAATVFAAGGGLGDVDIIGSKLSDIQIFTPHGGTRGLIEDKLDIVGSRLDNIKVCSDDALAGNMEIVGGSVVNVTISEKPHQKKQHYKKEPDLKCYWDSGCIDTTKYKPTKLCTGHLGVDAWYGTYWFNDQIYTPKWPQEY